MGEEVPEAMKQLLSSKSDDLEVMMPCVDEKMSENPHVFHVNFLFENGWEDVSIVNVS